MVKKLSKWYTILFCLYLCQFLIKSRDPLIHHKAKKAFFLCFTNIIYKSLLFAGLHTNLSESSRHVDCFLSDCITVWYQSSKFNTHVQYYHAEVFDIIFGFMLEPGVAVSIDYNLLLLWKAVLISRKTFAGGFWIILKKNLNSIYLTISLSCSQTTIFKM
jgi:hypothetical protein